QFVCFQCQPDIDSFLALRAQRQVMCHHTLPHEDVIEDAFLQEDPTLISVLSARSTAEVVGVDDLPEPAVAPPRFRYLVPYVFVKSRDADPGAPFVVIMIIVADVEEKISVVENTNPH